MSKRPYVSDFYGQKKKFKSPAAETKPHSGTLWTDDEISLNVWDLPSDTESAFLYLRSRFLDKCRECHLPIVVIVHQIYSIVKCRTTVDKDLRALQTKGVIRLFKLGGEESVLVVIKTDDLHDLVKERCPSKPVLDRFLKVVLPATLDVCIDKNTLTGRFCLTENDISDLMSGGLLTLRSVSSFWFSFPSSGEFVRTYLRGRKNVLRTIRKSKYSEILQQELEQRKMEKTVKLGMLFYVHDIIGAELVQCTDTTSGPLLRLKKMEKKRKNNLINK